MQLHEDDVERHDRDLRRQHQGGEDEEEHDLAAAPAHPRQRVRHGTDETTTPIVDSTAYSDGVAACSARREQVEDLARSSTRRTGAATDRDDSACVRVISAVSTTKTNGVRKTTREGDRHRVVGDAQQEPPAPDGRRRADAGRASVVAAATAPAGVTVGYRKPPW